MKRGILAIYDMETEYAYRLMDYLNRNDEFSLEVRVFTNVESLLEHMAENDIDLLLIGEGIHLDSEACKRVTERIVLTGDPIQMDSTAHLAIYKYQSADQIRKDILAYYAKQDGLAVSMNHTHVEEGKKVIGVMSPCGGSGNSTFANLLGQALSQQKKVLLINLEAIPGLYGVEESSNLSAGISDLIYYVKQGKSNIVIKLQSMIRRRGNLEYLLPADHYSDLYELSHQDVQLLMEQLYLQTNYDRIILDIGFISDSAFDFLNYCDYIYIPISENNTSRTKEESFRRLLRMWGGEEIAQRLQRIQIPFEESLSQRYTQAEWNGTGELGIFIQQLIKEGGL